jgi:Zn-dependent metalloprotease
MPTGTDRQEELLQVLRERDPHLQVTWHSKQTIVTHLTGHLTEPQQQKPAEIARRLLFEQQALFGIENADQELALADTATDRYGWNHVTFQQRIDDVPVWSSAVQVHMSSRGQVRTIRSNYRPGIRVDPVPTLDARQALPIAARDAGVEQSEPNRPPYTVVYVKPVSWRARCRAPHSRPTAARRCGSRASSPVGSHPSDKSRSVGVLAKWTLAV